MDKRVFGMFYWLSKDSKKDLKLYSDFREKCKKLGKRSGEVLMSVAARAHGAPATDYDIIRGVTKNAKNVREKNIEALREWTYGNAKK